MLQSQLFTRTSKEAPAEADSINARLLTQGGFVQQQMAGVYSFLPLGLRVLTKIQTIIREEMNGLGAQEILMPALTQIKNYQTTGRENLDILFHLKGPSDAEYVLNQSHEEVVTPLVQKHVFSYRDLPVAVYQIQNKFRKEPRARSGLLRGREFNMKDLYSFHATKEDFEQYYERAKAVYHTVYQRLGIGELTKLSYATGGSFSKYSNEFQTICESGEDTVYLCEQCNVVINKEIIQEQTSCPECGSTKLLEKQAIEVGNIFPLGTKFSDAFSFTYTDEQGAAQPVYMGCYGIGPSRVMGTIVEVFHDDRGIIWPESVAPYRAHVVGLDLQDAEVRSRAEALYDTLKKQGIEVLHDDRLEATAGQKFADADRIGIPWRCVVSKRSGEEIEVRRRRTSEVQMFSPDALTAELAKWWQVCYYGYLLKSPVKRYFSRVSNVL